MRQYIVRKTHHDKIINTQMVKVQNKLANRPKKTNSSHQSKCYVCNVLHLPLEFSHEMNIRTI